MKTSILSISAEDARKFFLRAENYSTIELPEYFQFQPIIDAVDKGIGRKKWKELQSNVNPKSIENVNFHFIKNKDGRYAWRPMQIIHPVMYVSLVNLMTECEHWTELQDRFRHIREHTSNIECLSMPLYKIDKEINRISYLIGGNQLNYELKNYLYHFHICLTLISLIVTVLYILTQFHGHYMVKKM